jgi:CRISPR/Cas system-associated endonuclease Cas3-HD
MPARMTDRAADDRSRINIDEPYEVRYWTEALSVSEAKLREAVITVGTSADAVRRGTCWESNLLRRGGAPSQQV